MTSNLVPHVSEIETFKFEDQDDDEYEIGLKVFSRKASFYHFSQEKLALLSLVKEITPPSDRKMIKLLTFDNLFPPVRHSH